MTRPTLTDSSIGFSRRLPTIVVIALSGLAVAVVGCGPAEHREPDTVTAPEVVGDTVPKDLNIVLVTIDTLRSDRISCYGSDRVDTPNIDSFAADGVLFSNATTTVPFTLPAHSSILTGLYPPGHGVRENVGYTLDAGVPTLAEVLSSHGWSTAGFVSAFVLDARWGIGRGFDHYYDDFDLSGMENPNLSSVQRSGDVTIGEAVRWLDQRPRDRPFFLWLHLYDPHDPYTPPEPYLSIYESRPYDGEVAYTDSLIGDFRQALEERGLLESSLVVLTADHGEGLGDHGEASHGFFLYDTTVHVGLIMRLPDSTGAGRVVDAAVSHVDLLPTILDAVNLEAPQPVHGQSLIGFIEGREISRERSVYSESLYPLLHYGWAPLRSIRTDSHKLISAPRPEVFGLAADPGELHNLAGTHPAVAEDLAGRLESLRERIDSETPETATSADLDPHTLAQLQALGYAAGQGGISIDEEDDRTRADPKDKIGLHRKMMQAQSLLRDNQDAATRTLDEIIDEDPEIIDAHQMLGQLASLQKRFEDALEHFRRALELDPEHQNSLMGMASSYQSSGRFEEALIGFRRALDLAGHDTRATLAIADIEFDRGNLDLAASALEDASATTEAPALIHNKLGEVRAMQGLFDDAVSLFETAIRDNDEFAVPHFNLAVLLEERGEIQPSVQHYEKAIALAPTYFQAQFNLGHLVGQMGQGDRQQELWEASIESNPGFIQGYYNLSKLIMDRGQDLARAEELVRLGISKDPDHRQGPLGYYVLADILNRTGRPTEAQQALATGRKIHAAMQ